MELKTTLSDVHACQICQPFLAHEVRPVLSISAESKILIIGQAPGIKVHESGIPWDDQSGKRLREWLGVSDEQFYNVSNFGILPMGFCYPGKGKSGDLPPRKECAIRWHDELLLHMPKVQIKILIGQYAQRYYLKDKMKGNLTETVRNYKDYLPEYVVLPHPSPRNGIWLKKHDWFEKEVVPELLGIIQAILKNN